MLFLVIGVVVVSPYMSENKPTKCETIRLVEAETEIEAKSKFHSHYSERSESYGDSCYTENVIASGVIS
jgi:hypothetical protein